jgi:anti-sigma regulatory factor (Ser/Thr protein kinase)
MAAGVTTSRLADRLSAPGGKNSCPWGDPEHVAAGLRVRLACEPASVPVARSWLREWWQSMGLPGELPPHIQLALTEAVTNAVRHAGCDDFEVAPVLTEESVILSVCDQGRGEEQADPGLGLGIAIIEALATSVDFEDIRPGFRVTMRFDRPSWEGGA